MNYQQQSPKDKLTTANELKKEFAVNEDATYTEDFTNRQQAQALLNKLKEIPIKGSCVAWVDGQPCRITTTRDTSRFVDAWTNNGKRIMMEGSPATDTEDRVPAEWEARLHTQNRRAYTLEQTPTMQFKGSANLPAEYYQDNEAIEAYIATLEDNTY